jgi:hypothetical protein
LKLAAMIALMEAECCERARPNYRSTGVEFADNPSKHKYHLALVFAGAPPLAELRSLLSDGGVLKGTA